MNKCVKCGIEGGFLKVKQRILPSGESLVLCRKCFAESSNEISNKQRQLARLKDKLIRRMTEDQIIQFCHEKSIHLTTEKRKYSRAGGSAHWEYYTYHYDISELATKLVRQTSIDEVFDFIERRCPDLRNSEIIEELKNL